MLLVDAVKTILNHFVANFTAASIVFDNEPVIQREDSFAHISIKIGDSQPNLDSTYKRTVGVVIVRVMVPKGHGDLKPWEIAQSVATVLELRAIGSVRLTSAGFASMGLVDDNLEIDAGWYQINVNIPFWFDHVV